MSCPFHFSRRAFLGGVAALAATPSASAAIAASAGDDPESSTEQASALPLEGEHQRGIVDPPQRYSVHCALDFLPEVSLAEYFRALTQRTRILVAGGPAAPDGIAFPATDSGELGLDIPTDYLTITVRVGAALFDDRFGLSKLKPAHLVQMVRWLTHPATATSSFRSAQTRKTRPCMRCAIFCGTRVSTPRRAGCKMDIRMSRGPRGHSATTWALKTELSIPIRMTLIPWCGQAMTSRRGRQAEAIWRCA